MQLQTFYVELILSNAILKFAEKNSIGPGDAKFWAVDPKICF